MPIFDQSYRAYTGARTGRGTRLLTIAWAGIRAPLRKRGFLALLLIGLGPFFVQFIRLYLAEYAEVFKMPTRVGTQELLARDPGAQFFLDFLLSQRFVLFILTAWMGAGLIADDLATGAMPLYLSRPIRKLDYIGGKLLSVLSIGGIVTTAPVALLFVLVSTKAVGSGQTPPLSVGAGAIAASVLMLLGYGLVLLAISSTTQSRRNAAFGFAALFIVSEICADLLNNVLRSPWTQLVSFPDLFQGTARLLLGLAGTAPDNPPGLALAELGLLGVYLVVSCAVLWLRVSSRSRA